MLMYGDESFLAPYLAVHDRVSTSLKELRTLTLLEAAQKHQQTAACNRHHSVEQQLCRWLLLTQDRVSTRELVITQELIAGMLGVRREGVTEAAGNLQRAGFISYRRGHIAVLDRVGLETHACECYALVRKELARLLSDVQYRQEGAPAAAAEKPLRAPGASGAGQRLAH